ncbi:hypothetical protein RRG08_005637 [Elysia crispata]|uniref:Uncharacterized protein n=1 Tax=Elysia crispata TaxID=231223 RepID=A0AAE0YZB4_9GAST|nr:hypothetical protein RRG08_005637 [Elysia crispata]
MVARPRWTLVFPPRCWVGEFDLVPESWSLHNFIKLREDSWYNPHKELTHQALFATLSADTIFPARAVLSRSRFVKRQPSSCAEVRPRPPTSYNTVKDLVPFHQASGSSFLLLVIPANKGRALDGTAC